MNFRVLTAAFAVLATAAFRVNGQDMMPTPPPTPPATISPAPARTPQAPPLRKGDRTPPSLDPLLTRTPTPLVTITPTRPAVTRAGSADIEALKKELIRDARFSRLTNVSVDPTSGVFKLAGEVSSKADRAYAGRLASSVPGVAVVYNEIQVHSTAR